MLRSVDPGQIELAGILFIACLLGRQKRQLHLEFFIENGDARSPSGLHLVSPLEEALQVNPVVSERENELGNNERRQNQLDEEPFEIRSKKCRKEVEK